MPQMNAEDKANTTVKINVLTEKAYSCLGPEYLDIYVYLAVVHLLNVKTDIVNTTHKIRVL